jgi:hypothetical protein
MSTALSLGPNRRNVRARGPGRSIRTEDWGHTGGQAAPMSGDVAFVVQAKSSRPGEGSFWAEKATRKDAVMTAADLIRQGMDVVTITDEDGRVFEPQEFSRFFAGDKR